MVLSLVLLPRWTGFTAALRDMAAFCHMFLLGMSPEASVTEEVNSNSLSVPLSSSVAGGACSAAARQAGVRVCGPAPDSGSGGGRRSRQDGVGMGLFWQWACGLGSVGA